MLKDTAKLSPMQALSRGLAEASHSADAVTGNGSLDVLRYGRILKARQLVGVRGVGPAYNGLYFVKTVTSKLKQGEFKQNFTLTRKRTGLNYTKGAGMSGGEKFFGKYRGTVINKHRSASNRTITGAGLRCCRVVLRRYLGPCLVFR